MSRMGQKKKKKNTNSVFIFNIHQLNKIVVSTGSSDQVTIILNLVLYIMNTTIIQLL